MKQPTYIRVEGVTVMYDIIVDSHPVGIVWQFNNKWYADRASMSAPAASGETREDAVGLLLKA